MNIHLTVPELFLAHFLDTSTVKLRYLQLDRTV